tara:strand:+ start:60 stop:707 length:648 start_codon:yes stop_codon:yes gene_type:complete
MNIKRGLKIRKQYYSNKTNGKSCVFIELENSEKGKFITVIDWIVEMNKYAHHLRNGAHLIFKGKEPLIQQESILFVVKYFKRVFGFKPFIEIETNGEIKKSKEFIELVDNIILIHEVKWEEIYLKIKTFKNSLDTNSDKVFGISKGGKIISGITGIATETPEDATILIDLVYDTGENSKKWMELYPNKEFVFLYNKEFDHKSNLIKFPWEVSNEI